MFLRNFYNKLNSKPEAKPLRNRFISTSITALVEVALIIIAIVTGLYFDDIRTKKQDRENFDRGLTTLIADMQRSKGIINDNYQVFWKWNLNTKSLFAGIDDFSKKYLGEEDRHLSVWKAEFEKIHQSLDKLEGLHVFNTIPFGDNYGQDINPFLKSVSNSSRFRFEVSNFNSLANHYNALVIEFKSSYNALFESGSLFRYMSRTYAMEEFQKTAKLSLKLESLLRDLKVAIRLVLHELMDARYLPIRFRIHTDRGEFKKKMESYILYRYKGDERRRIERSLILELDSVNYPYESYILTPSINIPFSLQNEINEHLKEGIIKFSKDYRELELEYYNE